MFLPRDCLFPYQLKSSSIQVSELFFPLRLWIWWVCYIGAHVALTSATLAVWWTMYISLMRWFPF